MPDIKSQKLIGVLRSEAIPLSSASPRADELDPLLKVVGDAHYVLIGEASHGTQEFYETRAQLTKRLIQEKGFHAVVVEADWPDAYRCNQYVSGRPCGYKNADDALGGFRRFPTWMWRNTVVVEFLEWLRAYNIARDGALRGREQQLPVGFYGMDLYSMHTSTQEVIKYLDANDPELAIKARKRFGCFDHFLEEPQEYGRAVTMGWSRGCEQQVVMMLRDLLAKQTKHLTQTPELEQLQIDKADEVFMAAQNARLVRDAETYYRAMFGGHVDSWNVRDKHMVDAIDALSAHLQEQLRRIQRAHTSARSDRMDVGGTASSASELESAPKVIVWAHNSHLGDARATEASEKGEHNVGQLVRERHGKDAVLIGFCTHSGTVTAASRWDGAAEKKTVRPGLPNSYEDLMHAVGVHNFILDLTGTEESSCRLVSALDRDERLQRAIGVIYSPRTERYSHYFFASLASQFDAYIHFDRTTAVVPLEPTGLWHQGEVFETYPFGV